MSPAQRQPRVFISRTSSGLKALAERIAVVLRDRGIEVIIQTGFYPSTHDVKGMLAEHLRSCDAVVCLIGTTYGAGPRDPFTKEEQPIRGLKDPRTKDRHFSYTQLELLIARDLTRPVYTFIIKGDELLAASEPEAEELAERQQTFITEFAKDGRNTYGTFSQWDMPTEPTRGLKQAIEAIRFEVTVLAGKPSNIPYTSLGTLFKGRDEFLAELRQHLTAEGPVVIKGKRTIHGMGGVGKTRAAIEYAWKHADDYNALLFISADSPEALHRNLATLCGPLVLNLPEQNEKEQALQVEAALRWLKLNPGWFLIIDNVDTDEAAEETKALLAKLTTGHVLITSRISDWTGHVKALDLDVLSEAASIAFLDERTDERRPKQDDDREKVAALVPLLDCLALALEQAGAHISTTAISYADYIALWESHRAEALAWHNEEKMKYPKSLAITYETSVAQLSDGAKELFRILSWFAPAPIPRSLLDSRPKPDDEKRCLGEIERLHLARYVGAQRVAFTIHRLNQEITRQQQPEKKPLSLTAALVWVDDEFAGDPQDVRTWPVLLPLTPHAIVAANFGADHGITKPSWRLLNQTAALLITRADYCGAEPLMRRVVSIAKEVLGENHPHVASALNNLAQVFVDTSRLTDAEPLMRRALAIDEASYGKEHPNVARDLNNLAMLLHDTNRLAEAEPLVRRALAIDEASFGKSHPKVARDLNNLAQVLQGTNRLAEAEPLMRRALAADEDNFGKDHPNVGIRLNNLARLYKDTNRQTDAETLLRRALAIDEASFGESHPKVAIRLNNLARLFHDTNRLADAEPLLRRALAVNENTFGLDHLEVATNLNNLAGLLQDTHREAEAEPLKARVVSIFERTLGKGHPKVAAALNNLAQLLQSTNRLAEAEPLMRRALAIWESSLGRDHPDVASGLYNIAALLQATHRLAEAEPLKRRAVEILLSFTRDNGHKHPHLMTMLNSYAKLRMAMGDTQEQAVAKVLEVMAPFGMSI